MLKAVLITQTHTTKGFIMKKVLSITLATLIMTITTATASEVPQCDKVNIVKTEVSEWWKDNSKKNNETENDSSVVLVPEKTLVAPSDKSKKEVIAVMTFRTSNGEELLAIKTFKFSRNCKLKTKLNRDIKKQDVFKVAI